MSTRVAFSSPPGAVGWPPSATKRSRLVESTVTRGSIGPRQESVSKPPVREPSPAVLSCHAHRHRLHPSQQKSRCRARLSPKVARSPSRRMSKSLEASPARHPTRSNSPRQPGCYLRAGSGHARIAMRTANSVSSTRFPFRRLSICIMSTFVAVATTLGSWSCCISLSQQPPRTLP